MLSENGAHKFYVTRKTARNMWKRFQDDTGSEGNKMNAYKFRNPSCSARKKN